jgi:predicted dehydrogenase
MDVGCYPVSGLRLIAGEPDSATGEQRVGPTGIDMSFRGELRFPSGVAGRLHCSFELPRRQELEIVGDEGRIRVEAPWRVDWGGDVLLDRDGTVSRVDVPVADSYALELDDFAQAVAGTRPPLLGREDLSGQARTIDALYRAAESGRSIPL